MKIFFKFPIIINKKNIVEIYKITLKRIRVKNYMQKDDNISAIFAKFRL